VAFKAARIVGPAGAVVGLDRSADALAVAERRRRAQGLSNVQFVEGEVGTYLPEQRFDALVGRLVLLYCPDPSAALRHHMVALKPGGLVVAMEFDVTVMRAVPEIPLTRTLEGWLLETFERSGLDAALGVRLHRVLREAGISQPSTIGLQPYCQAEDPIGPTLLAGITTTMLPAIERLGVATAEEVGVETLAARIATELREGASTLVYPMLVGAWGRTTPSSQGR
jgi:SAM-dependent methyltransferase